MLTRYPPNHLSGIDVFLGRRTNKKLLNLLKLGEVSIDLIRVSQCLWSMEIVVRVVLVCIIFLERLLIGPILREGKCISWESVGVPACEYRKLGFTSSLWCPIDPDAPPPGDSSVCQTFCFRSLAPRSCTLCKLLIKVGFRVISLRLSEPSRVCGCWGSLLWRNLKKSVKKIYRSSDLTMNALDSDSSAHQMSCHAANPHTVGYFQHARTCAIDLGFASCGRLALQR